jgi:hypothetical protein
MFVILTNFYYVCPLTIILFLPSLILLLRYVRLFILQWFLCVFACVCVCVCVCVSFNLYNQLTSFHEISNELGTTESLSNFAGRAEL